MGNSTVEMSNPVIYRKPANSAGSCRNGWIDQRWCSSGQQWRYREEELARFGGVCQLECCIEHRALIFWNAVWENDLSQSKWPRTSRNHAMTTKGWRSVVWTKILDFFLISVFHSHNQFLRKLSWLLLQYLLHLRYRPLVWWSLVFITRIASSQVTPFFMCPHH